ncbi:HTH domain-containing protein [Paenibacillus sp. 1001270B_150601_E10]|uniref:HTH domain-containing protein n=1 Tax=Paenibacillus sp. 1001270B_150601_E10 TaxID=2787079 RepID=UPI00189D22C0|nr:HTH domain-containing protein [Paenibacillus sp. 1001270B_150601_E10]
MSTFELLQRLYRYLIEHEEWVTGEMLAKELDCSSKTVRKYIAMLEPLLPEGWYMESVRGKGVYLHRPVYYSSHEVLSYVRLTEGDELKPLIACLIRQDQGITIFQLCQRLYYSESVIRKQISKLKEQLKRSQLKLHTKPIRIAGEERVIRQYQYDFFLEHSNELPLCQSFLNHCQAFIRKLEKNEYYNISYRSNTQLPILLKIWTDRLRKGHMLQSYLFPPILLDNGLHLDWLMPLVEEFLDTLHMPKNMNEIYYGASLILSSSIHLQVDLRCSRELPSVIEKYNLQDLMTFIIEAEKMTGVPLQEDCVFLQQIVSYWLEAGIRWVLDIHGHFQDHTPLAKEHEKLFTWIKDKVTECCCYAVRIRDADIAHITMMMLASVEEYRMLQKQKLILLYTSNDAENRYISTMLRQYLNANINIVEVTTKEALMVCLSKHHVHVIITSHKELVTERLNIPVFPIIPVLFYQDFKYLKEQLDMTC